MKKLLLLISFAILYFYSFTQTDVQRDNRVSPILKGAAGIWLNNPSNLQTLQNTAGFVISILNPDPNNTGLDFPGVGDEFGKSINMALRNRLGKMVQFFGEKGASFANKSEWYWAQKLLDEGRNVAVFKESEVEGVKSVDFFVDGIKTEKKDIRCGSFI